MSLSAYNASPRAGSDDESRAASTAEPEINSSSNRNVSFNTLLHSAVTSLHQQEDLCTKYDGSKYSVSGKQPAKEKAIQEYMVLGKDTQAILERKSPEDYHDQHTKELAVNEVNSIPVGNHSGEGFQSGLGFEEKSKQMDVQTEDGKRKIKSRGWCIKGSSCRFLHIKDGENPGQQPEEDVIVAYGKRTVELDEGFRNAAERSNSPSSIDTRPSSVVNKAGISSQFFPERILPLGHDENQRLHQIHGINKFPLLQSKEKSMDTSPASQRFSASINGLGPPKDVRENGIGQNFPDDNYAKPASLGDKGTFRNSFIPENISSLSGSVTSLGNAYNENQSHHVSTCLASLPLNYSSSACSLGAQKMLDNDSERCTSRLACLLQVGSPFLAYGDSTSTGPMIPERNDDKRTASCQNGYHENWVNNNCYPSGKDSLATVANDGTSAAEMQNGTLLKEEISSVASRVKNISKGNKIDTDHDSRHRRGGTRCKKGLEVDSCRENKENKIDTDHDSRHFKATRHFHAALVDSIKELLKPTWREGHLSKDAHNTIVRKLVDKVLGSIQPRQVPITFESVKQYLSSAQPKIARLVEERVFDSRGTILCKFYKINALFLLPIPFIQLK
ncbi:hypothetical protein F3Y22_tig00110931pilonHSYRG00171 [Hibiscus syriacus]|uniref:C3H1-type domain-containing protein n=1 Tax=Hibiscus syriacus TaxID=106335 RepID=A0A6A2ZDW8_HIBSY|nr:hypothetical protein F3Y22_tig00110931pilonHSYRG00171 [Hibiscus syriacus]